MSIRTRITDKTYSWVDNNYNEHEYELYLKEYKVQLNLQFFY